jgi:hypothetical protein
MCHNSGLPNDSGLPNGEVADVKATERSATPVA